MTGKFKSLIQLNDYFRKEKTCYEYLASLIWEGGKPVCPHCKSKSIWTTKSRSRNPVKKSIPEYRCVDCDKKFTVTVGTFLQSSKLPLRLWFAAIFMFVTSRKGISSLQLSRQLQVTQKTAWFMLHRIRAILRDDSDDLMKGIIEVDEAWIGGKNHNRHWDKKTPKRYNNAEKEIVVGLMERAGKVRTFVAPNRDAATLIPLIEQNVEEGSKIITDSLAAYSGLIRNYIHVQVKGDGSKENYWGSGEDYTNTIENFWCILKRGYMGVYHWMSKQHLRRYTMEYDYRYNTRKMQAEENFIDVIKRARKAVLPYWKLVGGVSKQFLDTVSTRLKKPPPTGYEHLEDINPNDWN